MTAKDKQALKWLSDNGYNIEDIPILLQQYVKESTDKDSRIEKLEETISFLELQDSKKTELINKQLMQIEKLEELVKLSNEYSELLKKNFGITLEETIRKSVLSKQIAELEKQLK